MAKSKIISELADCSISAEKALKRLYVIASDLNNDELMTWLDKEINGYSLDDMVPEYRNVGPGLIKYSGVAGTMSTHIKYTNQPFPFQAIPKQFQKDISSLYCRETIATIEQCAKSESGFFNDLSYMIPYIEARGIITALFREYDVNTYIEIKNKILAMLLKIFVKLDKEFGNLDDLDIGVVPSEKVLEVCKTINQFVFTDNSIRIGDNNKLEKVSIDTEG